MSKTIAIIGCGVSGLAAIKSCLDEGLTPVCFERSDNIGGLWRYTDDVTEGQGCVMRSTVINTSKEVMAYSDFPIPADFPAFMHNSQLLKYLEMYAEKFEMKQHIRFRTEVVSVKQTNDFRETGRWIVKVKDRESGNTRSDTFDGVMVCTGHHATKRVPHFEGLDQFRGEVRHTHEYRTPAGFEGKRVVVIGIGNSGSDVAVELGRIAKQVYLSTRRGCWVISKLGPGGLPADVLNKRRYKQHIDSFYPRWLRNYLKERRINAKLDHSLYGLQPKHHIDQQHPTGGDELPHRLASGTVAVRPDVRRFTETGVEFVDGRVAEDIDVVILATGYKFGFPFVQHPALEVKDNVLNLYKFVFPPDITPPTLAVIGCVQPGGSIVPLAEMQTRWVTRVFKDLCELPGSDVMWREIQGERAAMKRRFVESERHTLEVSYTGYLDDIAARIGCKPHLGKLLLSDPQLAAQYYFGTSAPYQYRLTGPGQWEGARDALMTVMDRTRSGLATRPPHVKEQHIITTVYLVFALLFGAIFRFLLF